MMRLKHLRIRIRHFPKILDRIAHLERLVLCNKDCCCVCAQQRFVLRGEPLLLFTAIVFIQEGGYLRDRFDTIESKVAGDFGAKGSTGY